MCGRYLLEDEAYADILQILYNLNKAKKAAAGGDIFPTNIAPVCTSDGITAVKWGFPHWKNSGVIINARAETASEKKMFGRPLRESRCVVPSSGFYEWSHREGTRDKDKYLLRLPGENALYMAGIVGTFRDAQGTEYSAFAILTTAANDSVSSIHDRMPVILAPDELQLWIDDPHFTEYALHRAGPELSSKLTIDAEYSYYENILD